MKKQIAVIGERSAAIITNTSKMELMSLLPEDTDGKIKEIINSQLFKKEFSKNYPRIFLDF
ncbi:hypothetical protein BpHYR1_051425 [Brachionus plicatilis]|uniref:Uncharacterized protein n=1 Tax=Brachionus plicatilis TaxID=10195 RepID=A0A3M7PHA4_BRAPC|nr:hypothetical protein BpHYR1_051425 [Brachionus plicatilis]